MHFFVMFSVILAFHQGNRFLIHPEDMETSPLHPDLNPDNYRSSGTETHATSLWGGERTRPSDRLCDSSTLG